MSVSINFIHENCLSRRILQRLTTKDADTLKNESPLPPPGPFLTPQLGDKLKTIQPKFAAFNLKEKSQQVDFPNTIIALFLSAVYDPVKSELSETPKQASEPPAEATEKVEKKKDDVGAMDTAGAPQMNGEVEPIAAAVTNGHE